MMPHNKGKGTVYKSTKKHPKGKQMADDNDFTVKDYDRLIDDIMDEYFSQHDMNFDLKELVKAQLLGGPEDNVPAELTLSSEMPGFEGGR